MDVTPGETDVTTYFMVRSATNGTAATGLTATTFDLQYTRTRELPSSKFDGIALSAADDAHADYGVIEVDATNSPGLYRVDWPDAAFASGAKQVFLTLSYSSAIFTETKEVNIGSSDADNLALIINDLGLNLSQPKTITENTEGTSYDETVAGVTKEVRVVGSTTTVTRTA